MTPAKTPAQPGRRRALRGIGLTLASVLLLLGGIAHGLGWLWLTGAMTVGFSDWVTQQRAQGWQIDHDTPSRGGWPFAARIGVPAFRIAGWPAALPQGFAWQAGRIDLTIAAPRIQRLVISADGPQVLGTGTLVIPYAAARLRAEVPLEAGPGPRPVALVMAGLRAQTPGGLLTVARIDARLVPGAADGGARPVLLAEAWQVVLPPLPGIGALGRDIAQIRVDAALAGPATPPVPMSPRDRAETWRHAGGAVELREAALRWGPLVGALHMTLRLDAALQPMGQGRLVLERPAEAIGALAAAGAIAPRAVTSAQMVATMMARVPEGGGAPRLDVPVGLDNGVVSLARLPVLRLPPVVWPDGVVR